MTSMPAVWQALRLTLGLVVICFLPGYVLARRFLAATPAPDRRSPLPPLERCFLVVATSLATTSLAAVLLAQLGWFGLDALILLLGAASAAVWCFAPAREESAITSVEGSRASAWLLGALLILSAILFTPPYQTVFWGDDSTVYVAYGTSISNSGAYLADDTLVQSMSMEARSELFRNRFPDDTTGAYARFPGGVAIPDLEAGRTAAGFSPLFPVWVAIFHQLFGPAWVYYVSSFFGMLGVAAVFFVGRSMSGDAAGFIAALLLAVCLPQIWFSRIPMNEVLAQFLLFSGIWALHRLIDTGSASLAAAAGLLLGTAVLARLDVLPMLALASTAFIACSPPAAGESRRARVFGIAFAAVVLYGLAHLLYFPTNYASLIRDRLERIPTGTAALSMLPSTDPGALVWLAVGVGGAAIIAFCFVLRRFVPEAARRRKISTRALWAGIALYGVAYFSSSPSRLGETIPWLAAYLSWPLLAVFAASAVGLALAHRREPKTLMVFALLAAGSLHYLYNPQVLGGHIWVMRRFVPIVIPGILLVMAAGLVALAQRFKPSAASAAAAIAAAPLLLFVAQPSVAVLGKPYWSEGSRKSAALAALFPDDAIVLVAPELAGTHMQTTLTYLHGVESIVLPERHPASSVLQRQILEWLGRGRTVYLAVAAMDVHFYAPDLILAASSSYVIDLLVLETTDSPPPQRAREQTMPIAMLRAHLREGGDKTAVDVGSYADDALFELSGFHGPEGAAEDTFRWTQQEASIEVPASSKVSLDLAGARPEGEAPAKLWVWIDDQPVVADETVPNERTRIVLDNPQPRGSGVVTLRIRSSVFNPRQSGLSNDERNLGVRLYRVQFGE
jgi:hypothetical protein